MNQHAEPSTATGPSLQRGSVLTNRWVQLGLGIAGMVAVANFQYAWTLFVYPMQESRGWSRDQIQTAILVFFMLAQTWLVPFEGYLADRFGPSWLLLVGGILAALAWVINSLTSSLAILYAAQVLSGCGSGIVYAISMGNALKWFPDRRGLAAGLTAAAFGAGSAATVLPIAWTIRNFGYETAFFWFGIAQGLVVIVAGLGMRFPRPGEVPSVTRSNVLQATRDFSPKEILRMPLFWLVYLMMTAGAIPGLLMVVELDPMARDFGIHDMQVTLLGIAERALPFALILDRIMGGLTRPVFGWISDHIGRELAIFLAFALEGTALLVLVLNSHNPTVFVLTSGLAFFGWGAIFSLFPAISGDMFGGKFATANYGVLYTAKGAAGLLIIMAIHLQQSTGRWEPVFAIMITADWIAALLAILVLRPLRNRSRLTVPE